MMVLVRSGTVPNRGVVLGTYTATCELQTWATVLALAAIYRYEYASDDMRIFVTFCRGCRKNSLPA